MKKVKLTQNVLYCNKKVKIIYFMGPTPPLEGPEPANKDVRGNLQYQYNNPNGVISLFLGAVIPLVAVWIFEVGIEVGVEVGVGMELL
jgi:hypothetical protein